jgi:hypothetical protein
MKAIPAPKFQPSPTVDEPFLWAHLALVLGVPWLLGLCVGGLAVGEPILPSGLEILLLVPAIALPAWWQWHKPLSPFSVWVAAKPINELTPSQLKILGLLKDMSVPSPALPARSELIAMLKKFSLLELIQAFTPAWNPAGWVAIAVAVFLFTVFRQLYQIAPLATDFAPFPGVLRLLGLVWALVFLALSSLILQMGVSAARILLVSPTLFAQAQPFPASQVKANFTSFGMRLPKFFDFAIAETIAPGSKTKSAKGGISFEVEDTNPLVKFVNLFKRKTASTSTQPPIQTKVTREPIPAKSEVKTPLTELKSEATPANLKANTPDTLATSANPEATTAVTEVSDRSTEATQANLEVSEVIAEANVQSTETTQVNEVLKEAQAQTDSPASANPASSQAESDLEQNPEVSNNSTEEEWV